MLNKQEALDRIFHALSDPARRTMLSRLSRSEASVSDLAAPLEMSLSAVVQHLAVLEESGLVRSAKQGRTRMCRIEPRAMRTAEEWLTDHRLLWERRLDALDRYLAQKNPAARAAKRKPRQ